MDEAVQKPDMTMPLISVIVPVYKVEPYIHRCVDSILEQTYQNLEIILVDDGSPDNCPAICDEYAAKDKRVKVIHKPNGGLSDARNAGMAAATGEYLSFVDSDDWLGNTHFECMMGTIKNENWMISGISYVSDNDVKRVYPTDDIDGLIRESLFGYAVNKLYRRRDIEGIYFGLTIREDIIFNLKVLARFPEFAKSLDSEYYYYQRDNSILHKRIPTSDVEFLVFYQDLHKAISECRNVMNPEVLYNRIFLLALSDQFSYIMRQNIPLKEKFRRIYGYIHNQTYGKHFRLEYADNSLHRLIVLSFKLRCSLLFLIGYSYYLFFRR